MFIDGCLSALNPDMARAYGMFSLWNTGIKDQTYIGWRIKVIATTGIVAPLLKTTEGVRLFWWKMGQGGSGIRGSVWDAFDYARKYGGGGVARALWGDNTLLDIGDPDGDDNLFVWGYGLITQIKLEP